MIKKFSTLALAALVALPVTASAGGSGDLAAQIERLSQELSKLKTQMVEMQEEQEEVTEKVNLSSRIQLTGDFRARHDSVSAEVPSAAFSRGEASRIVKKAYRVALRREADPAGLEHHINIVQAGKTYKDLRYDLASCPEGQTARKIRKAHKRWMIKATIFSALYVLCHVCIRRKLTPLYPRVANCFFIVMACLPLLFYAYLLHRYALNFPKWDDFSTIIPTLQEPFSVKNLLAFNCEHRTLVCRLVTHVQVWLSGAVNFRTLIVVGNFSLFLLFGVSAWHSRKNLQALSWLPIWSLLIFNLSNCHNGLWAMASLSNLVSPAMAFLTFTWLFQVRKFNYVNFPIYVVLVLFTVFSSAGGILILPALAMTLCAQFLFERFRGEGIFDRSAFGWRAMWAILPVAIFVGLYFIGYQKPVIHEGLKLSPFNVGEVAIFFFTILGAATQSLSLSLPFGLVCACFYLFLLWFDAPRRAPSCFAFATYVILSLIAITLARGGMGQGAAYSIRYQIFAWLLPVSLFLASLRVFPKLQRMTALHVVLLFCASLAYFNVVPSSLRSLKAEHRLFAKEMVLWSQSGSVSSFPVELRAYYSALFQDLIDRGLYHFPSEDHQSRRLSARP